jgi:hypothetical protein
MTFLNPFLLVGLAAAAIPIILHLLNLRKLRTVEFSSLQFLKELQKTKMRRLKIRQLLLLLVRTLIIIALVLAFSRPALRGSFAGTIGTHAKTTIVVILDDSPSMSIRNERGVLFTQAKQAVIDILNLMKEGDELYLVKLSDVRHKDMFTPSHTGAAVKAALDQLSPTHETAPFRDALGAAARILAESRNFNQEIYLVTDGQATQFTSSASQDSTDLFDDRAKLFLIETGSQQQGNVGLTSAEIKTQIVTQNKPVNLQAVARNFSATPVKNSVMSVYLDGARVVQQSLDIAAEGSATANVSVIPKRRGTLQGYLQLEDDLLDLDNKRFFVLNVPENIKVLLVGGTEQEVRLPLLALTLGGDTSFAGLFSTQKIAGAQLSSTDISKFDILICSNVKEFSPTEAERLAQFVKAGGGLMLFPGKESNIANYNETLFARLAIPQATPAIGTSVAAQQGQSQSFLSFDKIDFAHPLFMGLFEPQLEKRSATPSVESPRIYTSITTTAGRQGHEVITLSNGSGFLTEYPAGSGRTLLFSVEAGLTWSDFPVKGLFAPLLHRATVYLAAQGQAPLSFVAGNDIKVTVRLKGEREGESYVLTSPGGIDERVVPRFLSTSGMATFESAHASEAGIYALHRVTATHTGSTEARGIIQAIAVNVDPAESDLRRVDDNDLATFFKRVGVNPQQVRQLPVMQRIDTVVLESRFGVELWKYFIGLAVLLALIEMALGREGKAGQVTLEPART